MSGKSVIETRAQAYFALRYFLGLRKQLLLLFHPNFWSLPRFLLSFPEVAHVRGG